MQEYANSELSMSSERTFGNMFDTISQNTVSKRSSFARISDGSRLSIQISEMAEQELDGA
jgi:hypothetical protein